MRYADWLLDPGQLPDTPPVVPPWLLGPNGRTWLTAIGRSLDDNAERARQAVKARFPNLAPDDALAVLGEERGMPRGPGETTASYRARLLGAWDAWTWAGTPYGMLRQLLAAGYPTVYVQTQGGKQYSLASLLSGNPVQDLVVAQMATPVHLGGTPAELWSDFAVLIGQPWPAWWSGAPGDSSADANFVRQLIAKWKPAHTRCVKLEAISGSIVGLSITVGSSFTVGLGAAVIWTPPAG